MAKLTLNDKTIELDSVFEQIMRNTLNGNKVIKLQEGEQIPTIQSFDSNDFDSMQLINDIGNAIPLANTYNTILDYVSNYREEDNSFSYSITLGKK